jgi:hypothetical protein
MKNGETGCNATATYAYLQLDLGVDLHVEEVKKMRIRGLDPQCCRALGGRDGAEGHRKPSQTAQRPSGGGAVEDGGRRRPAQARRAGREDESCNSQRPGLREARVPHVSASPTALPHLRPGG